ncbi:MAG: 3-isopropylmalate dehydratase [Burkholderiales bacterium]|nr:3-isopropylmalate dehydratase [Burkholderiales bacterium]
MLEAVHFDGRILFLAEAGEAMARQMAGEDLALEAALPLRDQLSTDEITPAWVCFHYDEKLGDYVYLGLKCLPLDGASGDGEFPIRVGAIRQGGFCVSVAGARRGKGSSREASPFAELSAGIRLVIAESFERIYQQNCQNLGLLTSTDFGLIERIRAGEAIPIEAFLEDCDAVSEQIVRCGGLFGFNQRRLAGAVSVPLPEHPAGPMTYGEKLLARALGVACVRPGDGVFVKTDWRFSHEYVTPMAVSFLSRHLGSTAAQAQRIALHDPASILCFEDHLSLLAEVIDEKKRALGLLDAAGQMAQVQRDFCARQGIRLHGRSAAGGSEGICHALMAERYVLPGQIVAGTDSHTTHCGALGALAFGVGTTDMANAWLTGDVRLTVPTTCLIQLHGQLRPGVSAKDLVLHLLHLPYIRDGRAIGQIIEYAGPAVAGLSTDERATLTNMAAEIGGMTGLIAPDHETQRFLRERRGVDFALEPWMRGDAEACYAHVIEVDCADLEPMLAMPGDPGNGLPVSALREAVRIDIAYGGSCTGGKREDLRRYHEVLAWGLAHGMTVADHVEFYLQFGSEDVRAYCESQGFMATFEAAGVALVAPSCGACVNAGPGASRRADQVVISAQNRNFPGRSGPAQMWLASPATVAASALAGRIVSFAGLRQELEQPAEPALQHQPL